MFAPKLGLNIKQITIFAISDTKYPYFDFLSEVTFTYFKSEIRVFGPMFGLDEKSDAIVVISIPKYPYFDISFDKFLFEIL